MKRLLALCLLVPILGSIAQDLPSARFVELKTNYGIILLQLYPDKAPKTVENFLHYVNEGYYTDTVFHRVIANFMIQGGGFTKEMEKKPTREPIVNEADNGLPNKRGSIAMARTNHPHSATSQFFINVQDNVALNHIGKTSSRGWGYAVFGDVIDGMSVVDTIRALPTGQVGAYGDVPSEPVIIETAMVVDYSPPAYKPASEAAAQVKN